MSDRRICEGDWIRARWFQLQSTPASLSGAQLKFGALSVDISGIVRHIRCDNPKAPALIRLYIDPDDSDAGLGRTTPIGCTCEKGHVEIDPKWLVETRKAQ